MKQETKNIFEKLLLEYPSLKVCEEGVINTYNILLACFKDGGKVLVCGNGGSAADCEHIVGELMKGFNKKRELTSEQKALFKTVEHGDFIAERLQGALPAISLVSQTGLITAFCNDVAPELVFAQQVLGYLNENDVLIALSTSGNSKNVVFAAETAIALGGKVVSVTGMQGGALKAVSSETIMLPCEETYKIQELTLPVYHALCAMLEAEIFV